MDEGRARKAPQWTIVFLRALERTGQARTAAEDAGIDHTTAYARRRAHADFAADWAAALARFREARDRARAEELGAVVEEIRKDRGRRGRPSTIREIGEDLVVSGGQLKRAGPGRWSKGKERAFLTEMTCSANLRRACEAIGMSRQALLDRRKRDRHFAAAWDEAMEVGRVELDGYLLEAGRDTFDPASAPAGEGGRKLPKVSVAEAIKIVQLHNSKARKSAAEAPEEELTPEAVKDLQQRLLGKIERLAERNKRDQLQQGWSIDEATGAMVPPGWVRGNAAGQARNGPTLD